MYFGCSKKACFLCQHFVTQYPGKYHRPYQTRGSHGQVYLNWNITLFPVTLQSPARQCLEQVDEQMRQLLRTRVRHEREVHDSSSNSSSDNDDDGNDDDNDMLPYPPIEDRFTGSPRPAKQAPLASAWGDQESASNWVCTEAPGYRALRRVRNKFKQMLSVGLHSPSAHARRAICSSRSLSID